MWQTFVTATDWLILMLWCGKLEKKHKWKWFFLLSSSSLILLPEVEIKTGGIVVTQRDQPLRQHGRRFGRTTASHQMLIFRSLVVCGAPSVSPAPFTAPSDTLLIHHSPARQRRQKALDLFHFPFLKYMILIIHLSPHTWCRNVTQWSGVPSWVEVWYIAATWFYSLFLSSYAVRCFIDCECDVMEVCLAMIVSGLTTAKCSFNSLVDDSFPCAAADGIYPALQWSHFGKSSAQILWRRARENQLIPTSHHFQSHALQTDMFNVSVGKSKFRLFLISENIKIKSALFPCCI